MSKKGETIKNHSVKLGSENELNKEKLETNIEKYSNAAVLIIKKLKERRRVNNEFLFEIDKFIEYAENQVKNKNISSEVKYNYLDLINEEKSLRFRIKEDLKRNNELIDSIKKSTNALFS